MYINLLDSIGNISNKDIVLESLAWSAKVNREAIDIAALNKRADEPKNYRYFTESFTEVDDKDPRVYYLWLDSGYLFNSTYPIYISFKKGNIGFVGAYVGTEKYLIERCNKRNDKSIDFLVTDNASSDKNDFYTELSNRMMAGQLQNDLRMLSNYIRALISRITQKYGLDDTRYCILNKDGSKAIVNSSLVDIFGNDILIVFKVHDNELKSPGFYSKTQLIAEGFVKEDIIRELRAVPLYDNIKELIFDGEISDFDLDNYSRLSHILEERLERFPEEVRNTPLEILCGKLVNAIKTSVRISKRDPRYIVPMYNINQGTIQFMIPFHVNGALNEKPELAIIIHKLNGFYNIMTVIPTKDAYNNRKIVFPYSDDWIVAYESY